MSQFIESYQGSNPESVHCCLKSQNRKYPSCVSKTVSVDLRVFEDRVKIQTNLEQ